ncbi:MAG: aminotransferase class I/II-fold pyridoxal phosphate-dependent enzyme [Bacteroidetes bacterium]|nr:aminotransferase class I/II-fold pyridoxal phosphate-dependent enzyme [Bacteroidota bacterium]MBS1758321.1 aminotransferase class I/II-fold pyridoxal phosphate-dependent enzyme [Bacteroidota bacterium]
MKLSVLAETLIGSEIVKLGGIIKEKIRQGQEIYNYTIGDFDSSQFPIPTALKNEIIKAYNDGYTTYPAADGEAVLRNAVAGFIEKNEGLHYEPNEILIAAGGRPLIYAVYRAIVDKGDKVIYPVPSWNNNHYVHFTEAVHVQIEATRENNFMPTAAQIKPHIKEATLIAVCSPLNPTGTTFKKEELEAICDLVIEENKRRKPDEKKLYLMYDQIYWTLTYGDTRHYNPVSLRPQMKEYTIFIDGISKAFASTGVRVGWALGPATIIAKMKAINSHVGAWAPMAEQNAVAKFLTQQEEVQNFLTHFKEEISYRLSEIYKGFIQLKNEGHPVDAIAPQAAIYLTIQIALAGKRAGQNQLNNQQDVTEYILNEAGLAIVPFNAFGADKQSNWYRLSVGCCKKEDIPKMLGKLKAALQKLH